ncbi:hypothetical protein QQF64_020977, partial [Cirrhinus molitorella]
MVFTLYTFVWGAGGRACGVPLLLGRTHFKGHSLCPRLLKWSDRLTALGLLHFHTTEQIQSCL